MEVRSFRMLQNCTDEELREELKRREEESKKRESKSTEDKLKEFEDKMNGDVDLTLLKKLLLAYVKHRKLENCSPDDEYAYYVHIWQTALGAFFGEEIFGFLGDS
jgi:hypothetical protein